MFERSIAHGMLLCGVVLSAAAGSASVSFRTPVNYNVGSNPTFVATGDFNGDGKPDLAVVNAGDPNANDPGGISILLGNGDGTFQSAINFAAGNNPGSVAIGDFDGDGKDDLAVQRQGNGDNDAGDVTIFISNGDGTFTKGQVITSVVLPSALVAADFDSDGVLDLAAFQQTFSLVKVFLGKGDGTFSAPKSYGTPSTISAKKLEVLDFNRDGKKDIAVTGFGGGGSILIGNGDGSFQTGTSLGFQGLDSVEFVADFNHDGNEDAILTHCSIGGFPPHSNCSESAQLNDGNGLISPAPVVAPLPNRADTAGDFDGDGNPDLAGTQSSNNTLVTAVFLGNGDGSFQQPATFPASSGTIALAADLNVDGAPDLVITNSNNTVTVLLNTGTDFSVTATPFRPSAIGAGQSATSTVSLQLLNLFKNPVALSCSVQPAQAGSPTCSLSSNSVTFDSSGNATAQLTITAGSFARLDHRFLSFGAALWMPLVGFAFLGVGFSARTRIRSTVVSLLGIMIFLTVTSMVGCGGGSGSKPTPTNYTVTITGTSGATQHSTTATLAVQ